ncbi:Uncharacterized protein Cadr_000009676 [Camelus dromedarius]|uniref:Uncharacterized protein n=1 Tax=Camelus dromedarius TaxID=9838 RepID=A0A5N4DIV8_CAMDR|nr:Uncharacterized protein Cadr_000009676 [Camelus dromedarius]
METGTVDGPLTGRPSLASSWDAACGALAQRLHLTRADLGARDADWEELLAPPDTSQDLVVLKRNLNSQDENPCFLYLRCDPGGGEEIVSIGILSSARNMEVYLGEEYCGTSRGKNVCNVLDNRFVTYACAGVLVKYCFVFFSFCIFTDSLILVSDTRGE